MKPSRPHIHSQTILLFFLLGATLFGLYLPWFYTRTAADHIPWIPLGLTFLSIFIFLFYALKSGLRILKQPIEPDAPAPIPGGGPTFGTPAIDDLNPVSILVGLVMWFIVSLVIEFIMLSLFSATVYMVGALAAGLNWVLFRTFRYVGRRHAAFKSRSWVTLGASFVYSFFVTAWLGLLLVGPRMIFLR